MYIHIIIIKKIFLSKIWKLVLNNWKNVILCMFWIKMTKNRYPPGVQERASVTFAKQKHTTTQHTTPHPLPICSTASPFPVSLPYLLALPVLILLLCSSCIIVLCCTILLYYTCIIYIIYIIYIILHTHSNIIYLYYIYISILLVYLPIHYYIAILFYNQHSILYYHSISIYSFLDLCIYIFILFLYSV